MKMDKYLLISEELHLEAVCQNQDGGWNRFRINGLPAPTPEDPVAGLSPSELPDEVKQWLKDNITGENPRHGWKIADFPGTFPYACCNVGAQARRSYTPNRSNGYRSSIPVPRPAAIPEGVKEELASAIKLASGDLKKDLEKIYDKLFPDPKKLQLEALLAQVAALQAEINGGKEAENNISAETNSLLDEALK